MVARQKAAADALAAAAEKKVDIPPAPVTPIVPPKPAAAPASVRFFLRLKSKVLLN